MQVTTEIWLTQTEFQRHPTQNRSFCRPKSLHKINSNDTNNKNHNKQENVYTKTQKITLKLNKQTGSS